MSRMLRKYRNHKKRRGMLTHPFPLANNSIFRFLGFDAFFWKIEK